MISLHISEYSLHYPLRNIRKATEIVGTDFLLKISFQAHSYLKLYLRSEYADGHLKDGENFACI